MRSKRVLSTTLIVLLLFVIVVINACKHQVYVMPVSERIGDSSICFERDVLPIFQSNCAKSGCHDASSARAGYVLDSYADIVKNGIMPGNPAASTIWQAIGMKAFNVSTMPPNGVSLTANDLYLIRQWIATGAIDSGACTTSNCDTTLFTYSGVVAPLMQTYCVGCHSSAASAGGSLADYNDVATAAKNGAMIGDIEHLPGYNAMPQGGNMLETCQIKQIKEWVAAGALNN
jgi:hypothetical protein